MLEVKLSPLHCIDDSSRYTSPPVPLMLRKSLFSKRLQSAPIASGVAGKNRSGYINNRRRFKCENAPSLIISFKDIKTGGKKRR